MKKSLLLILLLISNLSFYYPCMAQGQLLGKWVLPIAWNDPFTPSTALMLEFTDEGINSIELDPIPEDFDHFIELTAGAYNPNYELDCYVLFENIYYGNEEFIQWNNNGHSLPRYGPEFQIINQPGALDKYFTFFTEKLAGKNVDRHLSYNEIWFEENNPVPQVSPTETIIWNVEEDSYIGIAITEEDANNIRSLYLASREYHDGYSDIPAGIRKWTISPSGISTTMEEVISTNTSSITQEDFSVYNLELKIENDGDEVLAWITNSDVSNSKVFVSINGNGNVYDLSIGRIGGIEFSSFDNEIVYVSCADHQTDGIVAMNYNTGTIERAIPGTSDFKHTFLQTAPDGHIYAVSNDGSKLGQLDMSNEYFTHDKFVIPGSGNMVSSFLPIDGSNYFILPENEREYCGINATVELQHVCPDHCDGEAWINESLIDCGFPPYIITWYDDANQVIGNGDHVYDLCEGTYHVEVIDFYEKTFESDFDIIVDPTLYEHDIYTVSLDYEEWNNVTTSFWHGITIPSGRELRLNNCHLEFLKPAKVIIEQDAKLVIDGSTLTYMPECDDKWQGIEVWGDWDWHQYEDDNGICHQGNLELRNSSEVSYAEVGVSVYKATFTANNERFIHWTTGGGIVKSNGTDFINNTKSIHFIPYTNYFPPDMYDIEMPNLSEFRLSNFDINPNNIGINIFYKHVDLFGVNGIKFFGCTFTNSAVDYVSHDNYGIAAYGAGFKVFSFCTQPMTPCPQEYTIQSSFDGFYRGIGVYSSLNYVYPYEVWDASFTNNHTGIYVAGVSFGVMVYNEFDIGLLTPGGNLCDDEAFGIDIFDATGFAIEDNHFEKMPFAPKANYVGVRIKNTNSGYDEVYRNIFDGLSYANLAVGKNWKDEDVWTGLTYFCNENTANWADFWVKRDDENVGGIQARQGDDDHAAGNIFSDNSMWNFYNGGQFEIGYYYCSTCPPEIPDDEKLFHVTDEARNVQNLCPDQYGGSGGNIELTSGERLQKETEYSDNQYDYNNVKSQYDMFVDGGNSEEELTDVQNAQPDEMWEIRAQLLGHSPHLSLEVLMEASDRTDVFPDQALFDILSANPDELKKDTLISYLENKEDPLPDYMIAILQQVANGTTYKTVLQNQMAYYNRNKAKAAYDIVRSIMVDTISGNTDLRNWLDNIGGIRADELIIATYMHENNYTDALSLANMLPTLYELSGSDSIEHVYFMDLLNLQINMKQQNRNIYQLDSMEMETLGTIADSSLSTAGAKARSILEYAYNYSLCNCLDLSDTAAYKKHNINWSNFDKLSSIEITAQPNPANTWAAFNFTLPSLDSRGTFRITDISGKLIQIIDVEGKQGQYIWDTRFTNPGVYLYTIEGEGQSKTGKIVVSK